MADSNYITSLAGELVPTVNKQIDEDTKSFFTYVDSLYKNEQLRLKSGVGSIPAQIDTFIANVKGIKKSVDEIEDINNRNRIINEWNITDQEAEERGYMRKHNEDIDNLNEAAGNMQALGFNELKKPDGNIDIAQNMIQGADARYKQEGELNHKSNDYGAAIARVAPTFKVPMLALTGKDEWKTLEEAANSSEYNHIMGAIRYAYMKDVGPVSRGQLRKHLFPKMKQTEQTLAAAWRADKIKSIGEEAVYTETKRFQVDIKARGPEAVLDWMKKNAKTWSGMEKPDWGFVRKKAVDELIAMVEDGSLPTSIAEQIFDHEFFAWDGSKQTVYDVNDPRKKPYWPEFAKLRAAVDKANREKINERVDNTNAEKKGFILDMNEKAAELTKNGTPLNEQFRETIQRQWVERFPGVPMPREVAGLLTTNEADDDSQIRKLTHLFNQGTTITMPMLYGIDDPDKMRNTINNLQVNRDGGIDQTELKEFITSEVNEYTNENDLTSAKTTKWGDIKRNATRDFVATYNQSRADGQKHDAAMTKARETVQRRIKEKAYDKYVRTPYNKESHATIKKAREAILADPTIFNKSLLPGLEKDAETMYNYISTGQWGDPPVDAFGALAQRTKGLRGMNTIDLAVGQANQYAKENGLPLVKWNQSSTQKALNKEPAEVTSALNSGDTLTGYAKAKNLPALLDTLVRPGSVDNGKADAILTDSGWRNSNNIYDKPLSQYTIAEIKELDQAGYGSYGIPNHVLEEIFPHSGLKDTDLFTEENQRKLHLAKVFFNLWKMNRFQTQAQFDSNPMLSNWNAMNIEPGDALEILERVGPTDFNNKQLLTKGILEALKN